MIDRILLDMDGVLCDFMKSACLLWDRPQVADELEIGQYMINEPLGLTMTQFWQGIDNHGNWWCDGMLQFEWARPLYKELSNIAPVTIATKPNRDPHCPSGKFRWLKKHIPKSTRSFMIGQDKYLMAKPNHVLIDDHEDNITLFKRHGGEAILFPALYNNNRDVYLTYKDEPQKMVQWVISEINVINNRGKTLYQLIQ